MGSDVVELSKEDSAEHWLSAGLSVEDEGESNTEDLRNRIVVLKPLKPVLSQN